MATMNDNKVLGYLRHTDTAITMLTSSPTGGQTDSLSFRFVMDTKEQADRLEEVLASVWQVYATSLQGYPVR